MKLAKQTQFFNWLQMLNFVLPQDSQDWMEGMGLRVSKVKKEKWVYHTMVQRETRVFLEWRENQEEL